MRKQQPVRQYDQTMRTFAGNRCESGLQIIHATNLHHGVKPHAQRRGGDLRLLIEAHDRGLAEFQITATRESPGTASFRISRRFPSSSGPRMVKPVTFPPGRAKLATSPDSTGLPLDAKTIGIVSVAALAARVPGVPVVTMTSG